MTNKSEERWAAHAASFRRLPGGERVTSWYRGVPSFHDADLVSLGLAVAGPSTVAVRFWRLEPFNANERALERADERLIVFTCDEVIDLELESFGPATVLNALALSPSIERAGRPRFSLAEPAPDDIDLLIEPHYGLSGWLRCRNLRVDLHPLE